MDHRLAKSKTAVFDGVVMIEKTANSIQETRSTANANTLCNAPITIFALPKAFVGNADRIQSNAFRSWMQLSPAVDVLLLGDEEGISEFAAEQGIAHIGDVERNSNGTPLVSSAFSLARQASSSSVLVYCNSDVILDGSFVQTMESLSNQSQFQQWLAIGQRTDVAIDRDLNFDDEAQLQWLQQHSSANGKKSSHVCKEYFAFSRDLFAEVPPFAVGRGNWDNWMVASAKRSGVPVIDLSKHVSAIHQSHDYTHMQGSRMNCYVNGDEARENQRLAGGRNLISGSVCTHRLGVDGVSKIGVVRGAIDFLDDVPRFIKLMIQLMLSR